MMFDPFTIGIGIALALTGWVAGRRSRTPRPPEPPAPLTLMCSCGDGYGTHKKGGKCQGQVKRACGWQDRRAAVWEYVPCPCLEYDGPEPAPKVWSISDPLEAVHRAVANAELEGRPVDPDWHAVLLRVAAGDLTADDALKIAQR